ncbi:hypothetical protein GJ744_012302 [Endocarpon pusillum]|uniref:Uncharacterized protein n=1 Tax=Endocarpon pusillum TaxID=364733 RepID=A0A8H7ABF1_9EURO|nr:hypothetical protein GJ744_012302 [Endocarpon pusillum]
MISLRGLQRTLESRLSTMTAHATITHASYHSIPPWERGHSLVCEEILASALCSNATQPQTWTRKLKSLDNKPSIDTLRRQFGQSPIR